MSGSDRRAISSVIRTLIVDDSAFVRKTVREVLTRGKDVEVVGQARDGEEALVLVEKTRPDVIVCDLQMPRLDGVEFVRQQMLRRPIPILILTASAADGELAVAAMEAGAVDLVRKPTALASHDLLGVGEALLEKLRLAVGLAPGVSGSTSLPAPGAVFRPHAPRVDVLLIGVSTGGPQALRFLIPLFAADFPVPIAIVLHMPVGYTASFAAKLDEISSLHVKEAEDGDSVEPGQVLLAKAGRHLRLDRSGAGRVLARLAVEPLDKLHRPSVDVLFRSAAETYGKRVLGVVMTGMGDDGKEGAAWVKARGGTILTEGETSCVVYGMPRAVVEAGLSDAAFPLAQMAKGIAGYL